MEYISFFRICWGQICEDMGKSLTHFLNKVFIYVYLHHTIKRVQELHPPKFFERITNLQNKFIEFFLQFCIYL